MANESRSRRPPIHVPVWEKDADIEPSSQKPETLHYTPLQKEIEEFRILSLHPRRTEDPDEPVHCSLNHTSFGKRPVYDALSYTWGLSTAAPKHKIFINGVPVFVGHNLGCALAQLRTPRVNRSLWVDAICINQADNEEKSSQIPLMPFIYTRAQTCLIWLMLPAEGWQVDFQLPDKAAKPDDVVFRQKMAFFEAIVHNEYWNRVWIIQEIGCARNLEIHFLAGSISWHAFIELLSTLRLLADSKPLELHHQILDKYSAGHSLQHLIESHRSSLCENPRDHIYGFVGLANDAQDFPIDYSKSLYEVWKDTLLFNTVQRLQTPDGVVTYARLVKSVLGGADVFDDTEITEDLARRQRLVDKQLVGVNKLPGQIFVPSWICGEIIHIGPTWTDMVAFPRKSVAWKAAINEHVEEQQRPRIREESDFFFRTLELLERQHTSIVRPADFFRSWMATKPPDLAFQKSALNSDQIHREGFHEPQVLPEVLRTPRLFMMNHSGPIEDDKTGCTSVGLAPSNARLGDLICRIEGITEAFVVRKLSGAEFMIAGTAALSKKLPRMGNAFRETPPFDTAKLHEFVPGSRLDLYMDITRIFQLV